jgi:hypothetical protein
MHGSTFRFQVPVPVSLYRCIAVSLFSSSRILHFWSKFAIIPTGNTTEKCQNNATLVWRDSGNARNGFHRSKCTYTREFDVIPAKELLIG